MKKLLVVLGILSANIAWADVKYDWYYGSGSPTCAVMTLNGGFIDNADTSLCQRNARSKYAWYFVSGSGTSCAVETLKGGWVAHATDESCERNVGYKYSWYNSGSGTTCAEVTPDGNFVAPLSKQACMIHRTDVVQQGDSPDGKIYQNVAQVNRAAISQSQDRNGQYHSPSNSDLALPPAPVLPPSPVLPPFPGAAPAQ